MGVLPLVFSLTGLASLILGYFGFSQLLHSLHQPHNPLDLLYDDLQLFVLGPDPLQNPVRIPWTLQIARFTAPTATVYAIVEAGRLVFGAQLRRLRARSARGHVIVCGTSLAAETLSRRLQAAGRSVVEVRPPFDPQTILPRGPLRVSGDARDPAVLRAAGVGRATALYACGEDSAANTAIALAAGRVRPATGRALDVYAQIQDPQLCLALQARYLGVDHPPGLRLDFFNIDDLAARHLLVDQPLLLVAGRPPRVLVVGASSFGRAVLVELARHWRSQQPRNPAPLPVTVIDPAADLVVVDLIGRYPLLGEVCEFDTFAEELTGVLARDELRQAPDRTFICDDDEARALKTAITVDRFWHGVAHSVVVRLDQLASFRAGLSFGVAGQLFDEAAGVLRVYGVVDSACEPELIGQDLLDRLAQAIHERYRQARLAAPGPADPFAVPWAQLPTAVRQTNRAQAEEIGRRLHSIGCVLLPRGEHHTDSGLRESEVDELARTEHERWRAGLADLGWRYGQERRDVDRLHPAVLEWSQLTGEYQHRTREAIRQWPGILADAGFQIVRAGGPDTPGIPTRRTPSGLAHIVTGSPPPADPM